MGRLLIVLALALLVGWLLFGRRRGASSRDAGPPGGDRPGASATSRIVACAHCGVHLPLSDAVLGPGDTPFCSEAHRDAGSL